MCSLPEKDLGGDIAVLFGLVPCLADDATFGVAEDTTLFVSRDGGY